MTDSMAVEYLRYQIPPQLADAFEAAIGQAMTLSKVEPTVVAYEIAKSEDRLGACKVRGECRRRRKWRKG